MIIYPLYPVYFIMTNFMRRYCKLAFQNTELYENINFWEVNCIENVFSYHPFIQKKNYKTSLSQRKLLDIIKGRYDFFFFSFLTTVKSGIMNIKITNQYWTFLYWEKLKFLKRRNDFDIGFYFSPINAHCPWKWVK